MAELNSATLIDDADLADDVEFPVRLGATPGLLKGTFGKLLTYLLGSASFQSGINSITDAHLPTRVFYNYGSFAPSNVLASEVLLEHIVTEAHTLEANFAGCRAACGVHPTAAWVANIAKNGTGVGTLSIDTAGVCTLATTGGATVPMAEGDILTLIAPATVDATIGRLCFTFKGTMA